MLGNARVAIMGAALLTGVPQGVAAQESKGLFQVPQGCQAFLTTQSRSCMVTQYWRCDADPEGTHWSVAMDQDGPFFMTFTDAEYRWLRSWSLRADVSSTLREPEDDPASLTELLSVGSDTMVFSVVRQEGSVERVIDYTGFDRLTGEQITVDDETLEVTEFTYQYDEDDGQRRVAGNQFVHRAWGLFFGGLETVTLPGGGTVETNQSPMRFSEPGEPGFLSTEPIFDCGDTLSGLSLPPLERG